MKTIRIKIVPDKKKENYFLGIYRVIKETITKEFEGKNGKYLKEVPVYDYFLCFFTDSCNHKAFKEGEIWEANVVAMREGKDGREFYIVEPTMPITW